MSTHNILDTFGIREATRRFVETTAETLTPIFKTIDTRAENAQYRTIRAMQNAGLAERHFLPATGYGYNDAGRDALERIFAELLGTEAALVRPHISSGTHAIACALYGVLRPGEALLTITGEPYDTVRAFIGGAEDSNGTLADLGVSYRHIDLNRENAIDLPAVLGAITERTRLIYLQRSTGYSWRPALSLEAIAAAARAIKQKKPDTVIFLDNCYGEFLSDTPPGAAGIDLMAGSLIKNPGGGIVPTGGYVAGRTELVHRAACRLAAPGVGGETGATGTWAKTALHGLFLAPGVTAAALKSAVLTAAAYKKLGFAVCPEPDGPRSDIIQSIRFEDPEAVKIFCRAVQEAAPVDAFVTPEPWDMPGYDVPVIMAAGAFIQGSSIELSADAPMRPPYIAYFQGGLSAAHGKLGLLLTLERLSAAGKIHIPS